MGQLNRSEWIDDDGSRLTGTPVDNEELQKIYDALDDELMSVNKPYITTRSIIDNLIAGVPFDFGGSPNTWTDRATYATGPGYDPETIIAPFSRIWKVDPALLGGVMYLEAILRTNDATQQARLALVNMTDAPNAVMVEIVTNSLTGAIVRSGAIAWPAGGAEKEFAVKLMTATPNVAMANAWGIRVYRAD
jgi:hypothetical protein